jgi:hypothetical protein
MTNTYRIKENIVHISMNAGILLQQDAIEVDSTTLTDFIIQLADTFEKKIVPTLEDGEYLESIDLFANKELLKSFKNTNFLPIGNMHHTSLGLATFYFFVDQDEVEIEVQDDGSVTQLEPIIERIIKDDLRKQGYQASLGSAVLDDSVMVLTVKKAC